MNVLIAEDDKALLKALKRILEEQGYFVDAVEDGLSALDYAKGFSYQLIVLDVMMPKLDGFEVVRILRKDGVNVPVLMLTAKATVRDKVAGLNFGADDYMTKPFETEEFLARVNALTRRTGEVLVNEISFEDISLNLSSAELSCGETSVQLSKKEFEVMKLFLRSPSFTVPKETLINNVWGVESEATDNNVEVYISFLRKKLKYLKSSLTVKNIQKIGYRLEKNA